MKMEHYDTVDTEELEVLVLNSFNRGVMTKCIEGDWVKRNKRSVISSNVCQNLCS